MSIKNVGGQAIIEGVYMRGVEGCATVVRKEDGKIAIDVEKKIPLNKRGGFYSLPFIRGVVGLIDSMYEGIKKLNYSASFFEEEEEESKFEKWMASKLGDNLNGVVLTIALISSVLISMVLFFFIPTALANVVKYIGIESPVVFNIIEGIIRVSIFIIYIVVISKMEDIKRLFMYHGAEHKAIFTYEAGLELTPENAKLQSRLHPRCGTNFMFLVMVISILLFSFTGWGNVFQRLFWRLLLLPVVAGITFEIVRWLGKSNSKLGKIIAYPGLQMQKLTTREPDLRILEVALCSLKLAEGLITKAEAEEIYNKEPINIKMKEIVGEIDEN